MESVLKTGFALPSKNDAIGGGGRAYLRHVMNMVAALVSTGWIISHIGSTNGRRNHSSPHVGDHFQICRQFSVRWSVHGSDSPDL